MSARILLLPAVCLAAAAACQHGHPTSLITPLPSALPTPSPTPVLVLTVTPPPAPSPTPTRRESALEAHHTTAPIAHHVGPTSSSILYAQPRAIATSVVTACHVVSNNDYSATFKVTVTGGVNWQFVGDKGHSGSTATYTVWINPTYAHVPTDGSYSLRFKAFSVTRPTGNHALAIENDYLPGNLVRSSPCPSQSVVHTASPAPS